MFPAFLLEGSFYQERTVGHMKRMAEPSIPKVDIPAMDFGTLSIVKFSVSEPDAIKFNTAHCASDEFSRFILPGDYTKLVDFQKRVIWMSDTTAERADHLGVYEAAKEHGGRILVHGLGLGVITNALLMLENVEHVEVWENDPEILAHIGSFYLKKFGSERLTLIQGDAMEHKPKKGERWSVVWHDIWPTLAPGNLKPMQKMCARFRARCDWQECWGRDFCRWMAKEQRNEDRRSGWR